MATQSTCSRLEPARRRHSVTAACGMPAGPIPRVIFTSSMAAWTSPFLRTTHAASLRRPPRPRITISFRLLFSLFFYFRPSIAQRDSSVEYHFLRGCIRIHAEIAQPLELVAAARRRAAETRLQFAITHSFERVRVQMVGELLTLRDFIRVLAGEQRFVQADFRVDRVGGRDPVDRRFHLTS